MRSGLFTLSMILALGAADARAQDCPTDDAMEVAAAELLARAEAPSPAELQEAVRAAGSDVPAVDAAVLARRPGAREEFLRRVARHHGARLRCGEATVAGRTFVIVGSDAGALRPSGDGYEVWLAPGYREARVFARDADGRVWHRPVRPGDRVIVPADLARPVTAQLIARGPDGPTPVAERRLGALLEDGADDRFTGTGPIVDRVAALRQAHGQPALRHNGLLARAAQAHAEAVCEEGRATHLSSDADPVERLARSGVRARHVGETVARADSLDAAYRRTRRSPSHFAALTDRRFTDVGVGVAEDDATCVVVLLASWPRAVPYD